MLRWSSGLSAALITTTALGAADAVPVRSPSVDAGSVLQVFLGLVVVLVVIGAVAWLLRHVLRLQPTMSGQLRILGGLSMGARERVVLLKVGETQLLLGVAPGRVHTLHVLDRPLAEPTHETRLPRGFAGQLGRALDHVRGGGGDG